MSRLERHYASLVSSLISLKAGRHELQVADCLFKRICIICPYFSSRLTCECTFVFFGSAVQGAGGVCPVETDAPSQTKLPARPCDALVRFGGEALSY